MPYDITPAQELLQLFFLCVCLALVQVDLAIKKISLKTNPKWAQVQSLKILDTVMLKMNEVVVSAVPIVQMGMKA